MEELHRLRPLTFLQSILLLLLLLLLLAFGKSDTPLLGASAFALLIGYHLFFEHRLARDRAMDARGTLACIAAYLLLCTLVVWTTRGEEESPLWIVFFLPIIIAAANLGLKATLGTCTAALLLFLSHLPPKMYLDRQELVAEFPEMFGFAITLFMVGTLVQTFARRHRAQLVLEQQLNERLREQQRHLSDSLERLGAAEASLRTKERLASLGEMSAGIAHEIRNPLGIISSSAQLLDGEVSSADARQLLDIIQEESTRLNGLITEFLTFGRQLEPQRRPCDLAALATRALDALRGQAEQKGISLELAAPESPCEAEVDADMLQQVLLNLLLNALQATGAGGRIRVALTRSGDRLDMAVSDTGCGIPEELLGKVFDPFFTTRSEGTGLGLANAYKIMESHDGTLSVTSRVGAGSTFTASLPLERP